MKPAEPLEAPRGILRGCLWGLLLWAVLAFVAFMWWVEGVEGLETAEAQEIVLPAEKARPPDCWYTYDFQTLRADSARGWMGVCPKGTKPSWESVLIDEPFPGL